jgi:hypothetical protein
METSGHGLYSLLLLDGVNAAPMIQAAAAGDRTAMAYVDVVRDFLEQCRSAPKKTAPLCLCCDRELYRRQPPRVIAVAVPAVPEPVDAMVTGLCPRCAGRAGWPRPGWQQRVGQIIQSGLTELCEGVRILDPVHFNAAGGIA